jgi:hypothetical protein
MAETCINKVRRKWLWLIVLTVASLGFIASPQCQTDEPKLQQSDITEIIDTLIDAYQIHYVYPDTARALGKHIRKNFADGKYDDATTLEAIAQKLNEDIRAFTHDRHIYISVMSPDDPPPINDTITDGEIALQARNNFSIRKAEWLTGNVGYVRFDGFEDAAYAGDAAAAAMNFVGRCDAVIMDLRYNPGGYETMVRFLASYFYKGPTLIGSLYFTETDSLEQSWTSAYVPGNKLVDADLYILISKRTGSGAEAFSYGMKHSGRAVLIGETTAGAAHWTEAWEFPSLRLRARIPIARPINPVTKTSWERTGVTPDIEVPSEDALAVAHSEAIKKLAARTTDEKLRSSLEWESAIVEAQATKFAITPEEMQAITGEFKDGIYAIYIKDDSLLWRSFDGTVYPLIPLSEDWFAIEKINDDYRLQIIRDDNNRVTGFRILIKGSEPRPIREKCGEVKR